MMKKEKSLADQAMTAMETAVRGVVEDHQRRNRPLATWRNGKVVYRNPHNRKMLRENASDYVAAGRRDAERSDA